MRTRSWTVAIVMLAFAVHARGHELSDLDIESWSGSGSNDAVILVDFWTDPGDSFAFGLRFDAASVTGLDALNVLHAADNGLTYAESGGFVTDFWYDDGGTLYHTTFDWPDSWWSYWLSEDYGEAWTTAPVGPADRTILPGDTDGWLALPGGDDTSQPMTPLIPEPSSGVLALLAAGVTLGRKRGC